MTPNFFHVKNWITTDPRAGNASAWNASAIAIADIKVNWPGIRMYSSLSNRGNNDADSLMVKLSQRDM